MQCFVDFAVGALSYAHTVGPSGPNQIILLSQCERFTCGDLCQILQYTLLQQSTETAILTDGNVSPMLKYYTTTTCRIFSNTLICQRNVKHFKCFTVNV